MAGQLLLYSQGLQLLHLVNGIQGVAQRLFDVLQGRTAFVRILSVFYQMQCRLKNMCDVENRCIRQIGLDSSSGV